MTGFDVLVSSVFLTAISAIIIFVISFIKGIVARTEWGPKIPGEVWIAVSVLFGIVIAVLANYNAINQVMGASPEASLIPSFFQQGIGGNLTTGVLIGLQTKVVYAVSTPIAAVLKAKKEEAKVVTATAMGACDTTSPVTTPAPIIPSIQEPQKIAEKEYEIAVARLPKTDGVAYILLDGVAYKVKKGE